MDPYLSSCLLLMAIMSTLVSYIYGSSVGIQVRKTKIWPSLALEVTLGKFSFSQVKKHISAHNFCNGQKFQCSISGPKYWCAVIWCRVRTSGDRMYCYFLDCKICSVVAMHELRWLNASCHCINRLNHGIVSCLDIFLLEHPIANEIWP